MRLRKLIAAGMTMALSLSMLTACGKEEEKTADGYAKEIYLYNWSEYMSQDVLDKFEDEYGITVVQSTYESNDEMLAKLIAGSEGEYDIIVPSNFYISALLDNDLIEPLDKDKIPNLKNIDESFLGLDYDPDNEYTVPYMGTVCPWVGNTKILKDLGVTIDSIDDLKDSKLSGNIMLTDDPQGNVGIGLMGCGYDPASTDLDEIAKSKDFLLDINENVKSYSSSTDVRDSMAKGEVALAYMYSGTAVQALNENSDLAVVMDSEECSLSLDTLAITKGSKHKEEAELFIDFVLRPDISAELTNEYQYVCFNKEAVSKLDDNLKNNPLCVLTEDMKKRLFLINTFDAQAISAEVDVMTEVKTAR